MAPFSKRQTGRSFNRRRSNQTGLVTPIEILETRVVLSADMSTFVGPVELHAGNEPSSNQLQIVNGETTNDFAEVGIVGDRFGGHCTGTLISPTHVLTAGHCAEGMSHTGGRFTINGVTYSTSRVDVHPNYNSNAIGTDRANDIAILTLSQPVAGVTPTQIYRQTPQVGELLTLVGFGGGGTGDSGHTGDFGTKRVGTTPIDGVSSTLITWSFDNNSESNTAPGDSGGPAYITVNGVRYVAGVTSGGDRADAGIGDHSFDTRVDAYAGWIDTIVGNSTPEDPPAPTPTPVPTDDHANAPGSGATVIALDANGQGSATGTLETVGDRDVFQFTLGSNGSLTVNLSETDGILDTFLYLYNSNGELIGQNDDGGSGYNSALTTNLTAGTYFASAGAYADSGTGSFRMDLAFVADSVPDPTPTPDPEPDPTPSPNPDPGTGSGQIFVSTQYAGGVLNPDGTDVAFDDSDILQLQLDEFGAAQVSVYFDGSDVGLSRGSEDIDAFAMLDDGRLLISTTGDFSVPGASGTGSDLLVFTPTSLGESTAGTWAMYLDGSDVGLATSASNIDAVHVLGNGDLAISTRGAVSLPGVSGNDEDLFRLSPTSLGPQSAGSWSMYFDGSDVGLRARSEDVDAVSIDASGGIHLSTRGSFSVPGVSGFDSDVFVFNPSSLGSRTEGAFSADLALDGLLTGLDFLNVDALQLGAAADPPPTNDPPADPASGGFQIDVQFVGTGLTASQQAVFTQGANRWSEIIVGDIPDVFVNGQFVDDVVIEASAPHIDGVGGVLGQAGPTDFRAGTFLPSYGVMEFDQADLADLERSGQLFNVIVHEMGHVIGIGTIWSDLGLVEQTGGSIQFVGLGATQEYNAIFSTNAAGVPVETDGGPGTAGGHWDEDIFGNELMTGYLDGGTNPISRITVAALADMGYVVNLDAADAYQPALVSRLSSRHWQTSGVESTLALASTVGQRSGSPLAGSHNERPERLASLSHLFDGNVSPGVASVVEHSIGNSTASDLLTGSTENESTDSSRDDLALALADVDQWFAASIGQLDSV